MPNRAVMSHLEDAFAILALHGPDPMDMTKRQALWTLWPAVLELFDGPPEVEEPRRAWSFRAKIAHKGAGEAYPDDWRYMEEPLLAPTQLDVFRQVAEFVTHMIGTTPPELHRVASKQRTRGLAVSLSRRGGVAPQHWSCDDGEGGVYVVRALIARGDWQENGSIANQFFKKPSEAFPNALMDDEPVPYTGTALHKAKSIRIKRKDKDDG